MKMYSAGPCTHISPTPFFQQRKSTEGERPCMKREQDTHGWAGAAVDGNLLEAWESQESGAVHDCGLAKYRAAALGHMP